MRGLNCSNCGRPLSKPFTVMVLASSGSTETFKDKVPRGVKDGEGAVIVYRHDDCRKQKGGRRHDGEVTAGTVLAPMKGLVDYSEGGIRIKMKDGRILMVMPDLS